MKFGWPISIIAHGLLGLTMVAGFSSISQIEPQEKVMRVHLASIDELTNLRASVKPPKPKPKPPVEEPMTLQTPMENAPEAGAPQERTVERQPVPDIIPEPDAEVEPEPIIQEPEAAPPTFDLDRISAVVDRTRDQQPEAGQQRTLVSEQNFFVYSQTAQAAAGEATALTLSEMDALKQRMYACWRHPADATNLHELVVEVRVLLQRDGSVSDVHLASPGQVRRSPNPFMERAAREAVNAVKKCSPYDFLPIEKYASWQDMVLRFIPEV